jgi:ferredoxin-NADP reductase
VAHYETRLADRHLPADDIMVFSLDKPLQYEFRPGQFCFLNLPDIGFQDKRGLRRHLSIASSPLEKKLLFATKASRSAFKQTLKEMNVGDIITIESPLGTFMLPEDTTHPLVFLAGGIGITPFRSMMRYVADAHTTHIVTLFYSNQTPQESAFIDEFQRMADTHGNISFVPTMTRIESTSTPWSGLTGRMTASMIREGCKEWQDSIFFIAGPPQMSESMKVLLADMDIQQHRVHVEKFTGY